jgi:hypothetical protein
MLSADGVPYPLRISLAPAKRRRSSNVPSVVAICFQMAESFFVTASLSAGWQCSSHQPPSQWMLTIV